MWAPVSVGALKRKYCLTSVVTAPKVLCGFYGNWRYISSERIREAAASYREDSFAWVKLVITP